MQEPRLIQDLKQNHINIHYFGLGFIQVKHTDSIRYHFYAPDLYQITDPEELHDHRYNFTSEIIAGKLMQEIWFPKAVAYGESSLFEVSCDPDHPVSALPMVDVKPIMLATTEHSRGDKYNLETSAFHRVLPVNEPTITRLSRGPKLKEFARVVRSKGSAAVCPFSEKWEADRLWQKITEIALQACLPC